MRLAAPVVAGTPLRALSAADEALYCALYGDADAMRHVGAALTAERARAAFQRVLAQIADRPPRAAYWVLPPPAGSDDGGLPAGLMALQHDARGAPRAEVGVLLAPRAQSAGLATAAIAALAREVFTSTPLQVLWTRHGEGHAAAAALMRRLGFEAAAADVAGECRWQLSRERWRSLPLRLPSDPMAPGGVAR